MKEYFVGAFEDGEKFWWQAESLGRIVDQGGVLRSMRGNGAPLGLEMLGNRQLITGYVLHRQWVIGRQKPTPHRIRQQSATGTPSGLSRQDGSGFVIAVRVMKPGSEHDGAAPFSSKRRHPLTYRSTDWQRSIGIIEKHQVLGRQA